MFRGGDLFGEIYAYSFDLSQQRPSTFDRIDLYLSLYAQELQVIVRSIFANVGCMWLDDHAQNNLVYVANNIS